MQANVHFLKTGVDHLKGFQCAEVNCVDGRALQNHVPDRRITGDAVVDLILKKPRVGKIEALVHPQGHDSGVGDHLVAQDIAVVFGARHAAHFGDMRFG